MAVSVHGLLLLQSLGLWVVSGAMAPGAWDPHVVFSTHQDDHLIARVGVAAVSVYMRI